MKRISPLLVILSLILSLFGSASVAPVHAQPDFPVPGGHFYTQASPQGAAGFGFRITDDGGIPFYTTYSELGGPDVLGYPISQRFMWQGFIHQATQKAILQWQPVGTSGQVVFANVFDELTRAGKDDWLAAFRSTPHPMNGNAGDVAARISLLEGRPAIKAKYNAVPKTISPELLYGLPTSGIQDMGNHLAVRFQRAVIQEWKQDTPWARAGDVTVANGGDIALEAGIIPPSALIPLLPRTNGEPDLPNLPPDAQKAAAAVRPAVVKITLANGDFGSGIIFDASGLIVTNAHVVERASTANVHLVDGRSFTGTVLGRDRDLDVAVVKIDGADLPVAKLGNSDLVHEGDTVVAIGYTAVVPGAPSARIGIVRDLESDPAFGGAAFTDVIGSDTFIHPGDSGGPLINLRGEVVGINTSITISDSPNRVLEASSLAINALRPAISRLQ